MLGWITAIGQIVAALPKLIELVVVLVKGNAEERAAKKRKKADDQWKDYEDRYENQG